MSEVTEAERLRILPELEGWRHPPNLSAPPMFVQQLPTSAPAWREGLPYPALVIRIYFLVEAVLEMTLRGPETLDW